MSIPNLRIRAETIDSDYILLSLLRLSGPSIALALAGPNVIKDWRAMLGPTKAYRWVFLEFSNVCCLKLTQSSSFYPSEQNGNSLIVYVQFTVLVILGMVSMDQVSVIE